MKMKLKLTKKQKEFIDTHESEVLFGGAAGGGKSYGQVADALLFALKYPKSKQLILRRTFAELDKSLIRLALSLYPKEIYSFNQSSHTGKFVNGSIIDFGYCAGELDVYQYQSAEYDVIRFDELTHFTESQYVYLISRVRGANTYPKQVKSTTNPGGIGHGWVKARFVDPSPAGEPFIGEDGLRRIFIPSLLSDNKFLEEGDPEYRKRLLALPERERRALLYGDWNIFEGQYFTEFDPTRHVIAPFEIPVSWRKYRTIDYGLDRLACLCHHAPFPSPMLRPLLPCFPLSPHPARLPRPRFLSFSWTAARQRRGAHSPRSSPASWGEVGLPRVCLLVTSSPPSPPPPRRDLRAGPRPR